MTDHETLYDSKKRMVHKISVGSDGKKTITSYRYPENGAKISDTEITWPDGRKKIIVTTERRTKGDGRIIETLEQDEQRNTIRRLIHKINKYNHTVEKKLYLEDGALDIKYSVSMKKNSGGRITEETRYYSNGNPAQKWIYFKPNSRKEGYVEIHKFSFEGKLVEKRKEYNNGKCEILLKETQNGTSNAY